MACIHIGKHSHIKDDVCMYISRGKMGTRKKDEKSLLLGSKRNLVLEYGGGDILNRLGSKSRMDDQKNSL